MFFPHGRGNVASARISRKNMPESDVGRQMRLTIRHEELFMKNPLYLILELFVNKNADQEEHIPEPEKHDDPFMSMIANFMNDERYLNCSGGSFH